MKQYIEMMGYKFEDRVTGYKGVAESVSFDLDGCVQIALRPSAITNEFSMNKSGRERTLADLKIADAAREMERNRCADIARIVARQISKGARPRVGSVEDLGEQIATEILRTAAG